MHYRCRRTSRRFCVGVLASLIPILNRHIFLSIAAGLLSLGLFPAGLLPLSLLPLSLFPLSLLPLNLLPLNLLPLGLFPLSLLSPGLLPLRLLSLGLFPPNLLLPDLFSAHLFRALPFRALGTVVLAPAHGVGQKQVGRVDLLEAIARVCGLVQVRVVLLRLLPEGFADFLLRRL